MDDLPQKLSQQVRTMQIIVLAMIVVPLIFAGVVLAIGSQAPQEPAPIRGEVIPKGDGLVVIERLALLVGLVALVAQQWMGRFVTGQAIKNLTLRAMHEPERLGEAYLTGLVVSGAINEMAAFLNLIAYMQSQSKLNLGMALVLIASTAIKWPWLDKVADWARDTAERLREEAAQRS